MPGTGDKVLARGRAEVLPKFHRDARAQGRIAHKGKFRLAAFQFRVLKSGVPLGDKLRLAAPPDDAQFVAAGRP